ncbi:carbohydrate ABC transporter permease [Paenibacillus sp. HB172176]|uniref:carbohydrate ABC transporter permease n=1 Tax=Paenibacillus sp. HB172176 TaxID=2493690 RepID=UPI00143C1634|nr:carbohydrate ABC transporter permease [Paenibacillus sp. HB172176]
MVNQRKYTWFDIVNISLLSIAGLTMIYPFVYMLAVSMSDSYFVARNDVTIWPKGFTLSEYKIVFNSSEILRGYGNTILYTVAGTLVSLLLTSLTAYPLANKNLLFGKSITLLFVFTLMFNGGLIPTFLVVRELGMMDSIWAMILPSAVSAWFMFIMRTAFQGIPLELEESGRIDGLSDFGIYWRIALPLSKAMLATIALFVAVSIWNNYISALLYLRDSRLYPLQVVIQQLLLQGKQNMDVGVDSEADLSFKFATIIVATAPILTLYPFLQKHFVKGVLIGSVKG